VRIARIGVFELDVEAGELRRSGRLVALTGQPMRVLLKLVERAGEVVTREELQREVWGEGTHVDFEAGLSTCINQVRTALGDRATSPRFLETLPRRGFRFIAPVEWPAAGAVSRRVAGVARVNIRIAAVAILFVMAAGFAWRVNRSQPAPVAIAVFAVDVDARTPELQPVSLALTDTLIGALVNEAGVRARVASPAATRELDTRPLHVVLQSGIDYVVFVTLRSLGGRVLVHVKLVDRTGFVRWASDRELPLDQLQREQLAMAGELSRQVVREIFGGGLISSSN
jgi:DNA-binding winged helix-turn-helix (wHTH) protein/TolB-like protein